MLIEVTRSLILGYSQTLALEVYIDFTWEPSYLLGSLSALVLHGFKQGLTFSIRKCFKEMLKCLNIYMNETEITSIEMCLQLEGIHVYSDMVNICKQANP